MDEVRSDEFGEEGGENVCKQNNGFGNAGADEILGCGEDDYVENVVY